MKKLFVLFTGLLVLCLNGCVKNQQRVILGHPYYDSSVVNFDGVDEKIVTDIRKRFNNLGLLEAQVIFNSSWSKTIFYKIDWLDENGFVLRNSIDEHYHSIELESNREFVLSKIATDKRAKSFKIYFTTKGTK